MEVSRDTSVFKWMPHGEGTYYKAVSVKVDPNLVIIQCHVKMYIGSFQTVQVTFLLVTD